MNDHEPKKDLMRERIETNLPGMRENLTNLEMRHAWLLEEAKKLERLIEQQRGGILIAESLLQLQEDVPNE